MFGFFFSGVAVRFPNFESSMVVQIWLIRTFVWVLCGEALVDGNFFGNL
jgi:hypothetical protein